MDREIPLVLLGIRTAVKADLQCSAAEMVFGTPLRVPGQFFYSAQAHQWTDPSSCAQRLSLNMSQLRPFQTRLSNKPVFLPSDLKSCSYVFLRHDAVRRPLQPVYDRPFRVVHRGEKTFSITKGGKGDTVSIDRLKPAYLENDEKIYRFHRQNQQTRPGRDTSSSPRPTVVPTRDSYLRTTRSGCHVKLPERLQASEMHRPSVPSRLGGS